MTDNLVELAPRLARNAEEKQVFGFDSFLSSEGLELLALYRGIGNKDVRSLILKVIRLLSEADSR